MDRERLNTDIMLNTLAAIQINNILTLSSLDMNSKDMGTVTAEIKALSRESENLKNRSIELDNLGK